MSKKAIFGSSLLAILALFAAGCTTEPVDGNNPAQAGPTITITSPAEGFVSSDTNVTVSGTASDSDGVIGTYLKVDSGAFKKIGTTSFNTNLVLAPGAHVLKIYAFDGQANSSATNTRNITVSIAGSDSIPPVLTVTSPASASTVSGTSNVTLAGTVSDNLSGVEGVYLKINAGAFAKFAAGDFSTNLIFANGTTNTLKIYAMDVSNNISATNEFEVIIAVGFVGPNWDFEAWTGNWPDNWTNALNGITAVDFTTVAKSALNNGYGGTGYAVSLSQSSVNYPMLWNKTEIPVTAGDQVIVKYFAKMISGAPRCTTYMAFYNGTNQTGFINKYYGSTYILDGSWKEIYTVTTIGAGTNYMYAGIEGASSSYTGAFLADGMIAGVISDIDSVAPSIDSWTTPADASTQLIGSVGFAGTVSDDVAVKYVYASIGSVTNMAVPASGAFTVNVSYLTTGTNLDIYLWAEDFAGHVSTPLNRTITLTNMDTSGLPTELFFSGYFESAPGSRKAIVIYNPTTNTVNLDAYKLHKGVNGAAFPGTILSLSNRSIPSGAVFAIGHGDATNHILLNLTNSTFCNWNGNDIVGLSKNGVLIDTVGLFGDVQATGWAVAGVANATVDHVLIRKYMVTIGTNDWAVAAGTDAGSSQWQVYSINADEWRLTNFSCVKP
ncbi:MAG: hypothetical protein HPY53_13725 [Brevinematales bacterium]|nr:hypothetical protein [Brevinematales bacterium]